MVHLADPSDFTGLNGQNPEWGIETRYLLSKDEQHPSLNGQNPEWGIETLSQRRRSRSQVLLERPESRVGD